MLELSVPYKPNEVTQMDHKKAARLERFSGDCPECKGLGVITTFYGGGAFESTKDCDRCLGKGEVGNCALCKGTGISEDAECPGCLGAGAIGDCTACGGVGIVQNGDCSSCNGFGFIQSAESTHP